MKIAFRLASLIAVAGLGAWLWTVFFPGPEKLIQRKITKLAATTTINANASNLARVAKATSLVDFFTTDAQIIFAGSELGNRTLSGREEIRESALAGFASIRSLSVQFLDVTVRLAADRQSADVSCTVKVTVGDSKDYGVQELHFQMKKVAGTWLISRTETVPTFS